MGIADVRGLGLETPRALPAVDLRHAQVHQDQIRTSVLGHAEAIQSGGGNEHVVTLTQQPPRQDVAIHLVVLDYQDSFHSASPMPVPAHADPRRWVLRKARTAAVDCVLRGLGRVDVSSGVSEEDTGYGAVITPANSRCMRPPKRGLTAGLTPMRLGLTPASAAGRARLISVQSNTWWAHGDSTIFSYYLPSLLH